MLLHSQRTFSWTITIDSRFDATRMRYHLIKCLENETLTPFPKTNKRKQEMLKDATI